MHTWGPLGQTGFCGCVACAMQIADGCRMFGAAIDNSESPWDQLVKSGYQIDIVQEDGSTLQADCDEADTIRQAIVDGKASNGVYIGGTKYKLTEVVSFPHAYSQYLIIPAYSFRCMCTS